MEQYLIELIQSQPWGALALGVLGALVVIAQGFVLFTPSPNDDNWLAKALALPVVGPFLLAVRAFAPWQKP